MFPIDTTHFSAVVRDLHEAQLARPGQLQASACQRRSQTGHLVAASPHRSERAVARHQRPTMQQGRWCTSTRHRSNNTKPCRMVGTAPHAVLQGHARRPLQGASPWWQTQRRQIRQVPSHTMQYNFGYLRDWLLRKQVSQTCST